MSLSHHFSTRVDWLLGRVADQSNSEASLCNTRVTDHVVILAEPPGVLLLAVEALHEETNPLGRRVSCAKTKVLVSGVLLDGTVQSVHVCMADIENLEGFTYLGNTARNNGRSCQEAYHTLL